MRDAQLLSQCSDEFMLRETTRRGSTRPQRFEAGVEFAHADIADIRPVVYKGGWFIGGSAGHGTLNFYGRNYPLDVGGIDYGFLFGESRTVL
jgi:hypothetical protein